MNKLIYLTIGPLLIAVGCSTQPEVPATITEAKPNKPGASIEAKQVAAQEESMYVAEIVFKKNSSALSDASKTQIKKVLQQANAGGEINNLQVLTWADAEYPSVHTKKLSAEDQSLVKKRNDSISRFLKANSPDADIILHSMAERPGLFKDMLNTTDGRLKKSLKIAGVPNTDTSVKNPSKASHSIIIAELK